MEANYFTALQWVLSYTDMNQPWSYMYSPSRSPLPPPSPPDSSGSSQCTRPEHLSHASHITSFNCCLQFSSVAQLCPTLCNPMNYSMPGLPVHHHLPEFTQTHALRVGDAIQPSHSLSSPSLPAPNHSQHQGLFQRIVCSHQVTKLLEL